MPVPVATIRVATFMQELHEEEQKFGALRSQDDNLCCNVQRPGYQLCAHSEVPFIDFHSPLLLFP